MMLQEVKTEISRVQQLGPFESYFLQYVMDIQDQSINNEISYMITHNVVSPKLVDRAILEDFGKLVKEW